MPPKTITYRSSWKKFKEAIRSNFSYIEGGNLTSLQHIIEKNLDQFPTGKIALAGNSKPHMTTQSRKAIIKRSRFKSKANNSSKPADKTAYKNERTLIVKLNKEPKKSFLQNQITKYYR